MAKGNAFGPDYFRMRENVQFMQAHEAMVDLISGRTARCSLLDALSFSCGVGLDNYPTEFQYLDPSDDEDYDSPNNRYCGFPLNFLDKGIAKGVPAIACFRTSRRISPEEAAKNAKELLDEEEKVKKKAAKKKQKKMRQRERRRQEKNEKENADKDNSKKVDPDPVKSKPAEKMCENKNKMNSNVHVPPDPGPQSSSVATDSSEGSDDDEDGDKESVAEEPEELDMNSCFVTNAAAIAKRKLEQKPKSDRKDKKTEKHGTERKSTAEPTVKDDNEKVEDESGEAATDFVTKSMELAVMGNTYAQMGNLEMAVKYFTDAIKHNPKEFKLFGNRSFCYEKMQQYEKALIDAEIALSLNSTWIKGLYRKGKALVGLKRYYEASQTYKDVLKLDSSCTDAAQELMSVQIMHLMDVGFSREQSSNALIIHGTVEKALEALSGLQASVPVPVPVPSEVTVEQDWVLAERNHPKVPLRTVPQNQPRANTAVKPPPLELFPIWVGDLVPSLTKPKIQEIFSPFGRIYDVNVLKEKRCAFVNYCNKEACEEAIRKMNGYAIAGTHLVVRYPNNLHSYLGASKSASTEIKVPDECFYWRTTGCIKNNRCAYRHVPEHKGIDRPKPKW